MPRKRPNGAGTIYRQGDKWRVTVSAGGRRVSRTVGTQAEAEAALVLLTRRAEGIEANGGWEMPAAALLDLRVEMERGQQEGDGWVYVILAYDVGRCKIGYAVDVIERFNGLRLMSPVELSVLAVAKGDIRLERALHRAFQPLRHHGEWFSFVGPLRDFALDEMTPFKKARIEQMVRPVRRTRSA